MKTLIKYQSHEIKYIMSTYYNDYEINIKAEVDLTYLLNIFKIILIIQYTELFLYLCFYWFSRFMQTTITINSELQ